MSYKESGRICTRLKFDNEPHDNFTKKLAGLLKGKINIDAIYTYCSCVGNYCNSKETNNGIMCYSTPSLDRTHLFQYDIHQLDRDRFFENDNNLIRCSPGITQCYQYGKNNKLITNLNFSSILAEQLKYGNIFCRNQKPNSSGM